MTILLIDNYDSFTYNLYHYMAKVTNENIEVIRNDKITIEEISKINPSSIILSPGPCSPNEAGICLDVIDNFKEKLPILGVCLGHQTIGQYFGGKIIKHKPMHGKISNIIHNNDGVFKNIPSPFKATRYHSLIIEKSTLPDCLEITATSDDGVIMGVKHQSLNIHGVQFHPESIASEYGHQLIDNFFKIS
ncbi:aminodeoxychorismate/anthranilate synthase component II [Rickettsiales bacterium]|nr:aminodeoxychorismate/anthranilate synthase component II [Rickettsiales bacterium]